MSFDEIAEKYGEEAAIHAGIASDPEWGPEELDMSDALGRLSKLPPTLSSAGVAPVANR